MMFILIIIVRIIISHRIIFVMFFEVFRDFMINIFIIKKRDSYDIDNCVDYECIIMFCLNYDSDLILSLVNIISFFDRVRNYRDNRLGRI